MGLKISSGVSIALVALLLLFAGCTVKDQTGTDLNAGTGAPPQNPPDTNAQNPAGGTDGGANPYVPEPDTVMSPILCNDDIIAKNFESFVGQSYTITKAPAAIGQTFQGANCLVKKDNESIITYNISEQPDEQTAMNVLEDQRAQYEQQLFKKSYEQYAIGTRSYFFESPVKGGSLYRLIFVDGTNGNVAIFIKTNIVIDKSVLEALAQALEQSI